jgi:hypothetical protein
MQPSAQQAHQQISVAIALIQGYELRSALERLKQANESLKDFAAVVQEFQIGN